MHNVLLIVTQTLCLTLLLHSRLCAHHTLLGWSVSNRNVNAFAHWYDFAWVSASLKNPVVLVRWLVIKSDGRFCVQASFCGGQTVGELQLCSIMDYFLPWCIMNLLRVSCIIWTYTSLRCNVTGQLEAVRCVFHAKMRHCSSGGSCGFLTPVHSHGYLSPASSITANSQRLVIIILMFFPRFFFTAVMFLISASSHGTVGSSNNHIKHGATCARVWCVSAAGLDQKVVFRTWGPGTCSHTLAGTFYWISSFMEHEYCSSAQCVAVCGAVGVLWSLCLVHYCESTAL